MPAERLEGRAAVLERFGIFGLKHQRLIIAHQRLLEAPEAAQRITPIGERGREGRPNGQSPLVACKRVVGAIQSLQRDAAVHQCFRPFWPELQRAVVVGDSQFELTQALQGICIIVGRICLSRCRSGLVEAVSWQSYLIAANRRRCGGFITLVDRGAGKLCGSVRPCAASSIEMGFTHAPAIADDLVAGLPLRMRGLTRRCRRSRCRRSSGSVAPRGPCR